MQWKIISRNEKKIIIVQFSHFSLCECAHVVMSPHVIALFFSLLFLMRVAGTGFMRSALTITAHVWMYYIQRYLLCCWMTAFMLDPTNVCCMYFAWRFVTCIPELCAINCYSALGKCDDYMISPALSHITKNVQHHKNWFLLFYVYCRFN